MRGFGWIAICAIINICMANIDQDIAKNKDKLATAKSQEKAISKKLDVLGKAINAKNSELTQLGNQINALEKDIEQNQGKSLSQEKSLKDSQKKQNVRVEVQIRTIAMDFWASLEHKLYYKETDVTSEEISARLKKCADVIAETDIEMQSIRDVVEEWENTKKNEI